MAMATDERDQATGGDGIEQLMSPIAGVSLELYARIVRSIQEAQGERAPTQRFVDRFARYYTPAVVLGEGLTDSLALSFSSPVPVFCAPGSSNAVAAVGPWVHGRVLFLALDCDAAGSTPIDAVANAALELGATRVRRLVWPDRAKDACEVIEKRGAHGLSKFLSSHVQEVVQ